MVDRILGTRIELQLRLSPAPVPIKADASQIEQVLMNLVINARDAMPSGGTLRIETAAVLPGAPEWPVGQDSFSGPAVMLAVIDTGRGISPDALPHIFEPFFTTKGPDGGTGLGLSTVYGIVRQSGGLVTVESAAGGSTFRVYLPRVAEAVSVPESVQVSQKMVSGSEVVLLVEDEEDVRSFVAQILRRNGYQVLEATNGAQALNIVSERFGKIDLVLTDVLMPRMTGPELAEKLSANWQKIKIVFMSGYAEKDALAGDGDGIPLLQKPFSPEELGQRLREALGQASGGR
jgi:CheY-like chemotaxis protein